MRISSRLFLLYSLWVFLFLGPQYVWAQEENVVDSVLIQESAVVEEQHIPYIYDSIGVPARMPDPASIDQYRKSPDYNYTEQPAKPNLWERFWRWFFSKMQLKDPGAGKVLSSEWFWYTLFALVMGFVLFKIFRSEITGLFYKTKGTTIDMEALEEDINAIDFEKQIQEAIAGKRYRYAIRLHYLRSLKALHDRSLIDWKIGKTNSDYIHELRDSDYYQGFADITYIFNWVWYGEMPLSENTFMEASQEFISFNRQLPSA